ncbi:MAG: ankyrin repeat domain-containing protein [Chitinophagaceae bacterium]|nr:ankyrin repeat domain-containing protein [Chitinophagaceae bacterium]
MKKQINNSLRTVIAITFLSFLSIMASCQQKKDPGKNAAVSQTRVKPPKIDIHTAVVTGNMEALKQHIAAGSNINEKDPFGGSSPLISVCLFGKTEMAKALIDAGADLDFRNKEASTALITASFFCRPAIVRMLLDKGADKTIKNVYGQTAYEAVAGPFTDVKNAYDGLGKMLEPMGLKLDYAYIKNTRPEIAAMLK